VVNGVRFDLPVKGHSVRKWLTGNPDIVTGSRPGQCETPAPAGHRRFSETIDNSWGGHTGRAWLRQRKGIAVTQKTKRNAL